MSNTIAAISTAPGIGGIGIVRMSGDNCFEILDKIFKAKNPEEIDNIKGYTIKRKISPGKHKLTVYAPSGIISTPFEFEVEQYKSYKIEMDYKLYAQDGIYDVFGRKIFIIR